jgi:hypothetical protein
MLSVVEVLVQGMDLGAMTGLETLHSNLHWTCVRGTYNMR